MGAFIDVRSMGEFIDVKYDSYSDSDGSPGKSANSATMTARRETEGERGLHADGDDGAADASDAADNTDPAALWAAAVAHGKLAERLSDLVHELRTLEADAPSAGLAAAIGARSDAERRHAAAMRSFTNLQARAGRAAFRQQQRKAATTAACDDARTLPTPRGEEEDEPLHISRVEAAAADGLVNIGVYIGAGGDGYEAETTCCELRAYETEPPSIGFAAAVSTRAVAERMALQQQKRTAAAAGGEEGEEDGADAVEPPCEFDPPLGLFLARLGMIQHLPALVAEDMSLVLLRLLSEDDLHSNLGEMGLKRGARCRIILGLRKLTDDGAGSAGDDADGLGRGGDNGSSGGGGGGPRAAGTGRENKGSGAKAAEPVEAMMTTEKPLYSWVLSAFQATPPGWVTPTPRVRLE